MYIEISSDLKNNTENESYLVLAIWKNISKHFQPRMLISRKDVLKVQNDYMGSIVDSVSLKEIKDYFPVKIKIINSLVNLYLEKGKYDVRECQELDRMHLMQLYFGNAQTMLYVDKKNLLEYLGSEFLRLHKEQEKVIGDLTDELPDEVYVISDYIDTLFNDIEDYYTQKANITKSLIKAFLSSKSGLELNTDVLNQLNKIIYLDRASLQLLSEVSENYNENFALEFLDDITKRDLNEISNDLNISVEDLLHNYGCFSYTDVKEIQFDDEFLETMKSITYLPIRDIYSQLIKSQVIGLLDILWPSRNLELVRIKDSVRSTMLNGKSFVMVNKANVFIDKVIKYNELKVLIGKRLNEIKEKISLTHLTPKTFAHILSKLDPSNRKLHRSEIESMVEDGTLTQEHLVILDWMEICDPTELTCIKCELRMTYNYKIDKLLEILLMKIDKRKFDLGFITVENLQSYLKFTDYNLDLRDKCKFDLYFCAFDVLAMFYPSNFLCREDVLKISKCHTVIKIDRLFSILENGRKQIFYEELKNFFQDNVPIVSLNELNLLLIRKAQRRQHVLEQINNLHNALHIHAQDFTEEIKNLLERNDISTEEIDHLKKIGIVSSHLYVQIKACTHMQNFPINLVDVCVLSNLIERYHKILMDLLLGLFIKGKLNLNTVRMLCHEPQAFFSAELLYNILIERQIVFEDDFSEDERKDFASASEKQCMQFLLEKIFERFTFKPHMSKVNKRLRFLYKSSRPQNLIAVDKILKSLIELLLTQIEITKQRKRADFNVKSLEILLKDFDYGIKFDLINMLLERKVIKKKLVNEYVDFLKQKLNEDDSIAKLTLLYYTLSRVLQKCGYLKKDFIDQKKNELRKSDEQQLQKIVLTQGYLTDKQTWSVCCLLDVKPFTLSEISKNLTKERVIRYTKVLDYLQETPSSLTQKEYIETRHILGIAYLRHLVISMKKFEETSKVKVEKLLEKLIEPKEGERTTSKIKLRHLRHLNRIYELKTEELEHLLKSKALDRSVYSKFMKEKTLYSDNNVMVIYKTLMERFLEIAIKQNIVDCELLNAHFKRHKFLFKSDILSLAKQKPMIMASTLKDLIGMTDLIDENIVDEITQKTLCTDGFKLEKIKENNDIVDWPVINRNLETYEIVYRKDFETSLKKVLKLDKLNDILLQMEKISTFLFSHKELNGKVLQKLAKEFGFDQDHIRFMRDLNMIPDSAYRSFLEYTKVCEILTLKKRKKTKDVLIFTPERESSMTPESLESSESYADSLTDLLTEKKFKESYKLIETEKMKLEGKADKIVKLIDLKKLEKEGVPLPAYRAERKEKFGEVGALEKVAEEGKEIVRMQSQMLTLTEEKATIKKYLQYRIPFMEAEYPFKKSIYENEMIVFGNRLSELKIYDRNRITYSMLPLSAEKGMSIEKELIKKSFMREVIQLLTFDIGFAMIHTKYTDDGKIHSEKAAIFPRLQDYDTLKRKITIKDEDLINVPSDAVLFTTDDFGLLSVPVGDVDKEKLKKRLTEELLKDLKPKVMKFSESEAEKIYFPVITEEVDGEFKRHIVIPHDTVNISVKPGDKILLPKNISLVKSIIQRTKYEVVGEKTSKRAPIAPSFTEQQLAHMTQKTMIIQGDNVLQITSKAKLKDKKYIIIPIEIISHKPRTTIEKMKILQCICTQNVKLIGVSTPKQEIVPGYVRYEIHNVLRSSLEILPVRKVLLVSKYDYPVEEIMSYVGFETKKVIEQAISNQGKISSYAYELTDKISLKKLQYEEAMLEVVVAKLKDMEGKKIASMISKGELAGLFVPKEKTVEDIKEKKKSYVVQKKKKSVILSKKEMIDVILQEEKIVKETLSVSEAENIVLTMEAIHDRIAKEELKEVRKKLKSKFVRRISKARLEQKQLPNMMKLEEMPIRRHDKPKKILAKKAHEVMTSDLLMEETLDQIVAVLEKPKRPKSAMHKVKLKRDLESLQKIFIGTSLITEIHDIRKQIEKLNLIELSGRDIENLKLQIYFERTSGIIELEREMSANEEIKKLTELNVNHLISKLDEIELLHELEKRLKEGKNDISNVVSAHFLANMLKQKISDKNIDTLQDIIKAQSKDDLKKVLGTQKLDDIDKPLSELKEILYEEKIQEIKQALKQKHLAELRALNLAKKITPVNEKLKIEEILIDAFKPYASLKKLEEAEIRKRKHRITADEILESHIEKLKSNLYTALSKAELAILPNIQRLQSELNTALAVRKISLLPIESMTIEELETEYGKLKYIEDLIIRKRQEIGTLSISAFDFDAILERLSKINKEMAKRKSTEIKKLRKPALLKRKKGKKRRPSEKIFEELVEKEPSPKIPSEELEEKQKLKTLTEEVSKEDYTDEALKLLAKWKKMEEEKEKKMLEEEEELSYALEYGKEEAEALFPTVRKKRLSPKGIFKDELPADFEEKLRDEVKKKTKRHALMFTGKELPIPERISFTDILARIEGVRIDKRIKPTRERYPSDAVIEWKDEFIIKGEKEYYTANLVKPYEIFSIETQTPTKELLDIPSIGEIVPFDDAQPIVVVTSDKYRGSLFHKELRKDEKEFPALIHTIAQQRHENANKIIARAALKPPLSWSGNRPYRQSVQHTEAFMPLKMKNLMRLLDYGTDDEFFTRLMRKEVKDAKKSESLQEKKTITRYSKQYLIQTYLQQWLHEVRRKAEMRQQKRGIIHKFPFMWLHKSISGPLYTYFDTRTKLKQKYNNLQAKAYANIYPLVERSRPKPETHSRGVLMTFNEKDYVWPHMTGLETIYSKSRKRYELIQKGISADKLEEEMEKVYAEENLF